MWISVGLIPGNEKGQEELANEYFETLVRKSFFEPKFSYFNTPCFNMHDLAQVISKNECLQVVSNDPEIQIPQSIRHLSIETNNILVLKNLSELKYLRTLLLCCNGEDAESVGVNIVTALKGLKTIRYLQWLCDFPIPIGDLIHLRCLRIYGRNLSPCIGMLYHLQILKFYPPFHPSEKTIPANICKLSKLKRLDLPEGTISTIPHIGKLSSLQKLIGYSVKTESGYDISELEMMSKLHELTITNLENVKSTEEATKANLNLKQHLFHIELHWDHDFDNTGGWNESDKEVADWLTPQFLPNLTAINLAHCSSLERLPPFGQLPYLKILTLKELGALKVIGLEFYGSSQSGNTFPALETLELFHLIQLEEWRDDTQSENCLPCLKRLEVYNCPCLKKLPPIPTTLKELELAYLGIATFPGYKQKNEGSSTNQGPWSLSSLCIIGCSNLISLKSGFLMHPEQLASLEELKIYSCDKLVALPSEGFRELISLKSVMIGDCRRLLFLPMLLPKNFFPRSVQQLILGSCGDLATSLPQLLQDLSLLSSLQLKNCANLISLPSANVLQSLTSLKNLEIEYCERLKSLGGLEAIPSLKVLVIGHCPMLATNSSLVPIEELPRNRLSMALDYLRIDEPDLLLVVPLRNVHLTKSLGIVGGLSTMLLLLDQWFVQNGASLQSLNLCSVREVHFILDLVEKLPSLRVLALYNPYSLNEASCIAEIIGKTNNL